MTSKRTPRRWGRAAAATLALSAGVVAAGVATISTRVPDEPAVATDLDGEPVVVIARDPHAARRPPAAARRARDATAKAVARTFVKDFLVYELGDLTPRTLRRVRRAASPRLAHMLLRTPPRRPLSSSAPAAARLRSVVVYRGGYGRAKAVATLTRGSDTERLELTLHRTARGWRVTGLG